MANHSRLPSLPSRVTKTSQHQMTPVIGSRWASYSQLLDRAASAAEANSRQSLEAAQRLWIDFTPPRIGSRRRRSELQFYPEKADGAKIGSTISPSRLRIAPFAGQKRNEGKRRSVQLPSNDPYGRSLSLLRP